MADKEAHPDGMRGSRSGVDRLLPPGAKVNFHKVCVLCRRMPRVRGRRGEQTIHVKDGVLIPQSGTAHEDRQVEGNLKLLDRTIVGSRIDVRGHKVRGSGNHHKFMVVVTDGVVS